MVKQIPITHNISELIPQAAAYLTARKDLIFAYLFGSLTSGMLKPLSDVDIAVYLKKRKLSEKRLEIIGDRVLHENHILNKSLQISLEKMAKFRSYMVHHYDKIEPDIVVGILHKNLKDFEKFETSVIRYLKERRNS